MYGFSSVCIHVLTIRESRLCRRSRTKSRARVSSEVTLGSRTRLILGIRGLARDDDQWPMSTLAIYHLSLGSLLYSGKRTHVYGYWVHRPGHSSSSRAFTVVTDKWGNGVGSSYKMCLAGYDYRSCYSSILWTTAEAFVVAHHQIWPWIVWSERVTLLAPNTNTERLTIARRKKPFKSRQPIIRA